MSSANETRRFLASTASLCETRRFLASTASFTETRCYKDAYFLIFDIENKLGIKINERVFYVRISNSAFIEKHARLYVPFQININGKRYDCEEIEKMLGFMPLMNVNARYKMSEITIAPKPKEFKTVTDVSELVSKAVNYAMMNNVISGGYDEEEMKRIEDMLKKYSYETKNENQSIIFEDNVNSKSLSVVVSNESISKLMKDGFRDIIRPQYRNLYDCCVRDSESCELKGPNVSIGYYAVRNGEIISLAAQQHLAIYDRAKRRFIDILE